MKTRENKMDFNLAVNVRHYSTGKRRNLIVFDRSKFANKLAIKVLEVKCSRSL